LLTHEQLASAAQLLSCVQHAAFTQAVHILSAGSLAQGSTLPPLELLLAIAVDPLGPEDMPPEPLTMLAPLLAGPGPGPGPAPLLPLLAPPAPTVTPFDVVVLPTLTSPLVPVVAPVAPVAAAPPAGPNNPLSELHANAKHRTAETATRVRVSRSSLGRCTKRSMPSS
jgi:hypothetical protein